MLYNDFKGNKWIEYLDDERDGEGCRYVLADTPDDILEVLVDLDIKTRLRSGYFCNFSRVPAERYIPIRDRQIKKRGLTKKRLGYDD
ncbi:MAG: hypothetical protein GX937_00075 [Lentisphaerae bacterium]|jgi:hypothetical protein|nr:hypothetical protein [Lentisphaerota bacterium]